MGTTSAVDQKLDYLTLLVTELQNQNPLEPMEQKDMAAQLAQFSQLELALPNSVILQTFFPVYRLRNLKQGGKR